jgi:hypothetical protein
MRKCWRLVRKDGKEQVAATRKPAPAEPDEEADETASIPNAPTQPTQVRTEVVKPSPSAPETWTTRNLSGLDNAPQPSLLTAPQPSPPADAPQPAESLREQVVAQATANEPTAAPAAEPPVQALPAAAEPPAPEPDAAPASTWHMLLWAIALLGVLGGVVLLAIEIAMRRTDVLNTVRGAKQGANQHMPVRLPERGRVRPPTFAPLPPMDPVPHEDDVEEALRRFARSRTRAA